MDGYHYLHGCAVRQEQELPALKLPPGETMSGFSPMSVLLGKPQLIWGAQGTAQGSHRKAPDTVVQRFKQPPPLPCTAGGTPGPGHRSSLLAFLTHLGTSFPTPPFCELSKAMENSAKGKVFTLSCCSRWALPGWPWGGSSFPCHSTAHGCFSMLQYTDWATGNYIAFISICSVMVLNSQLSKQEPASHPR